MIITAPHNHPALQGHFPHNPLIPGVVLLDWAWQAAQPHLPPGSKLTGLSNAKFLAPVRPGDTVQFEITPSPQGAAFKATVAGQLAAQGSFTVRPA